MLTPPHSKIGKSRVLIVDDQPVVRERLAQLINADENLTLSGAADNSPTAFELIAAGNPHLVITGLSLKGSHGLDFIKDLRSRYPEVRVLVFSAHDESVYAERAVRAGARGFVTTRKPTEHVLAAIRHILGDGIYLSDRVTSDAVQRFFAGTPRAKQSQSELGQLSDRELQVFEFIGRGRNGREIATALYVNIKTVETYRSRIKVKLGIHSGGDLAQRARKWVEQAVSVGELGPPLDNRPQVRDRQRPLHGSTR